MANRGSPSAQGRLLLEIHAITTAPTSQLESSSQTAQETGSTQLPNDEDLPITSTHVQAEQSNELSPGKTSWQDRFASDQVLQINTAIQLECSFDCRCQCHFRRVEYRSPPWLRHTLGWFFLSYQSRPLLNPVACDLPSCRNSRPPVYFEYYFPSWAWNRAISFTAAMSALTGIGANVHISMPRLLPADATIWHNIHLGHVDRALINIRNNGILPWDKHESGTTVLSVSTTHPVLY